jgi:hypothetical protein
MPTIIRNLFVSIFNLRILDDSKMKIKAQEANYRLAEKLEKNQVFQ